MIWTFSKASVFILNLKERTMKFSLNYLQKTLLVSGVILTMPALASDWDRPETTVSTKIYFGCNLDEFKANGERGCTPVEEYTWTSGGTYLTGFQETHGFFINGTVGGVDSEELVNLKTIVTSQGENLDAHTQSIGNLEGQLSTLNQQQNQLETNLSRVQSTVTTLDGKVAQNTQNIASHAERIQNLDGRVTQNTQGIANNQKAIQDLDGRVAQNTQGIANNQKAIQSLDGRVTQNTQGIANNQKAIQSLDGRVTQNTQGIANNQKAIQDLDGRVAQNTLNIADNKVAIQQNKEVIAKGINIATDKGSANYQLGDTIKVHGGKNIQTQQKNGNIVISLVDNPQFKGELNAQGGLVAHHYLATPKNTLVDFGGNRVQNVGDAVHDNDAVNLRQLKRLGTHMNNEVKSLHKQLRHARKTAHAGTASALAVASMPQAWNPDQAGMSLGTAIYRGETGYAMGLSRMSSSGRWVVKGALTADSRGGMGATVGAFFAFE